MPILRGNNKQKDINSKNERRMETVKGRSSRRGRGRGTRKKWKYGRRGKSGREREREQEEWKRRKETVKKRRRGREKGWKYGKRRWKGGRESGRGHRNTEKGGRRQWKGSGVGEEKNENIEKRERNVGGWVGVITRREKKQERERLKVWMGREWIQKNHQPFSSGCLSKTLLRTSTSWCCVSPFMATSGGDCTGETVKLRHFLTMGDICIIIWKKKFMLNKTKWGISKAW